MVCDRWIHCHQSSSSRTACDSRINGAQGRASLLQKSKTKCLRILSKNNAPMTIQAEYPIAMCRTEHKDFIEFATESPERPSFYATVSYPLGKARSAVPHGMSLQPAYCRPLSVSRLSEVGNSSKLADSQNPTRIHLSAD